MDVGLLFQTDGIYQIRYSVSGNISLPTNRIKIRLLSNGTAIQGSSISGLGGAEGNLIVPLFAGARIEMQNVSEADVTLIPDSPNLSNVSLSVIQLSQNL